jgi:hypothetical protein
MRIYYTGVVVSPMNRRLSIFIISMNTTILVSSIVFIICMLVDSPHAYTYVIVATLLIGILGGVSSIVYNIYGSSLSWRLYSMRRDLGLALTARSTSSIVRMFAISQLLSVSFAVSCIVWIMTAVNIDNFYADMAAYTSIGYACDVIAIASILILFARGVDDLAYDKSLATRQNFNDDKSNFTVGDRGNQPGSRAGQGRGQRQTMSRTSTGSSSSTDSPGSSTGGCGGGGQRLSSPYISASTPRQSVEMVTMNPLNENAEEVVLITTE